MKRLLVTGIGGNVGQGIIRNLRAIPTLNAIITGTNTIVVSAGNHLCEQVYQVPAAYEANFVAEMVKICEVEKIDLIIPSTDYETYHLGLNADKLPTIICSPAPVAAVFLDKYKTYQYFKKHGIPFAESILPSAYSGMFKECIVKPREGRGSRNIFVNPAHPNQFDDSYMVQALHKGKEITTAFYVTKNREWLGQITLERSLSAGTTSECEVIFDHDDQTKAIALQMIEQLPIAGPCNIQSIVTAEGEVVPFEINGRYSGTNSIRSQFGFNDVLYGIQEYLLNEVPLPPTITAGCAVRIYMDVIYPDAKLTDIQNNQSNISYLF